jgi:AAA+ ATPase superfamily predicted ATPase
MMQGLTLAPNAPLYGRARELLKLRPVPAGYIGEALGFTEAKEQVEAYAVWGGVPRYWELAAPLGATRDAVEALALDPLGPLHDEPPRLLLEDIPPAIALRPVLDAIGAGAHRVSEIAGRIGQPATSLARPLGRLQELDLVVREIPYGEPERSSKRALYKLADPFLRLWFSLIAPKRSLLVQVPKKARLRLFDPIFPQLAAAAWEELCRQAVPHLGDKLGGVEFGPAARYWSAGGPEWDLVAEAEGGSHLLGEVKWIQGEPSASAAEAAVKALVAKGVPPIRRPPGAEVHHAVFMSRLPRPRPRVGRAHVHFVDAADVLGVLR